MYTEESKPVRVVWALVLGLGVLLSNAEAAVYSGGTGTEKDPYQLGSAADWMTLYGTTEDWDKHFVLTGDIDFVDASLTPIGTSETQFVGTLDGKGHVVRNGQINLPESDTVGLFGYLGAGGEIQNLGVEAVDITGKSSVGGMAGTNSGTILSCYTTGAVTAVGDGDIVGGLAGQNFGTITYAYATGQITGDYYVGGLVGEMWVGEVSFCHASCQVSGNAYVGGLVAEVLNATVSSCHAAGQVAGNAYVGGMTGYNEGTILDCYSRAAITCGGGFCMYIGGLVGRTWLGSAVSSYWDTNVSGQSVSDGGEGRTTLEMTWPYAENTYVDWDFATVWAADEDGSLNEGYPYLREKASSQPHPADLDTDYRIVLGEAIAYLAGWQQGSNPIGYAIRAAYLWQNGEHYGYDGNLDPPMCWLLVPPAR